MAQITLKGSPIQTVGELPAPGTQAPDFKLVKTDLSEISLKDFSGKKMVLNIFPSIDTPVCSISVRRFNNEIENHPDAVALCISMDLPFAHARFCAAEGLKSVVSVSAFRNPEFGRHYGVTITDGPLRDLLARAVVILDATGKVIYTELVPEIGQEPDYDGALFALAL
ncbi:MAG: thiol peroxidase [Desulfobacterales bacterium]|nr:thiol peroxidase [Desulfobacterales bacterium]